MNYRTKRHHNGFTLTELLVALGILVVVVTPLTIALIKNGKFMMRNKEKLIAESIASEQIEIIRNLQYDDVGTDTGWPHGVVTARPAPVTREGISFQIEVNISYVDDPYDGTFPADLYSYDYKKVEVTVNPVNNSASMTTLTTNYSPPGPETESNTGVLEIRVIDANGDPVPDADVTITNNSQGINIITQTMVDGKITVPALPPDNDNYHVVTSKIGYSMDQTNPITAENPNPAPKDQSVLLLQLTNLTLSIDLLASMTVNTIDINGTPIVDPVTFNVHGEKTIGTDGSGSTIYKYNSVQTTTNGSISFNSIEWDSYTFELDAASAARYNIMDMEAEPPAPMISASFSLPPNSNPTFNVTLAPI